MIFSHNSIVLGSGSSTSGVTRISGVELDPQTYSYSSITDQWATGASAEKTYLNKTTGDYAALNMIGAPTSTLGATQSAFRQGWLINDTSVWIELTYDTPVYLKSVVAREVYNIKTMHKLEAFKDGAFVTVWQRDIDTDANETGGVITNEVTGKFSDTTITLTNILDYKVDKIRLHIGETTGGWNGVDSVKLNGSETRTEDPVSYKINYNNLKNKPAHNFADLKNIPALFNPVYGSTVYSPLTNQWVQSVVASSQFSNTRYKADNLIGEPRPNVSPGDPVINSSTDSWAESSANIRDLNTLTLTYATAVYVKEVMLVELIRGGTASKLEVDNNGTFVTVWSRDVNTGENETGGTISGGNLNVVSHTKITLDEYTSFLSNRIRVTVGLTIDEESQQHIDAIQLTGSESIVDTNFSISIDYDDLENKPPTITATQIDDNLTSNSVTNALSANQGRIIKDLIDAKVATQIDDNLTSNDISRALSANQGRVLKNLVDSKADASSVRNAAVQFKNITDIPSLLNPTYGASDYSPLINQWVQSVVASSQFSDTRYKADNLIGEPRPGVSPGDPIINSSTDSWAESNANIRDLNTLTLTYATAVYVKEVMLVELIRGGTASKLEVDNNGTFVTVWSRDVNTGANETGGRISGGSLSVVSHTKITLDDYTSFLSNRVRVTVGLTIEEESQQHIDAIQLTGSETLQQTDFSIAIDYNDLENKPTATPATEISDNLTSNSVTRALSANQGRVIKALIDGKADASNFRSSTAVRFKDITGFPSIFDPVPTSFNYSALINQWVNSVVASSQFSGTVYEADNLIGEPRPGVSAGDPVFNSGGDAWAENRANRQELNYLTLTYTEEVYIKEVTLIELNRGGTASKLEVDNNGTFVTVWSRDVNTGENETGGVISGDNLNVVSHSKIILDNYTDFLSKKIRVTVGRTTAEDSYQHIDAIQLTGSVTRTEDPFEVLIDYNDLENKPTIAPATQISDNLTSNSTTSALSANQGSVIRALIDAIVETQVSDSLTSNSTTDALSANQGMVIKALIDTKADASSIIDASVQFKNITGLPSILAVKPRSYTYGAPDSQWVQSATASSQYSPTLYNAGNLVGTPRANVSAGDPTINSPGDSWAESDANQRKLNYLTLTYEREVYIKEVILIELNRGGTASKIEAENNGTLVTVWNRDVNTGENETGGTITGGNFDRVSHTKITLDNHTDFLSKKIRITVGGTTAEDAHQHIDAIQLIGSETRTENTIEIGIDYNDLENIPAVTFEDITSNKAQYDYTVTYYATSATANSEKIKKKIFSVPGGTDITATYTHVTSGYNKIVLSGGTPASITKKTKQYAYTDGKQTAVTYT